ncbi:MAG: lipid-A-disaccharide synthase, partial [bacterium]
MPEPVKIGLVVGESSGDQLGAPLMDAIRSRLPDVRFGGMGGQRMIDRGFESLFPMERLSVMGFVDPLKRLPELLHIRRTLFNYFLDNDYDLVVGVDSPDFNLGLELKLRERGLKTAHYVSPSVWAWRQGRVKKIRRAVDHMLTLFPFEADFYRQHDVPVTFVGHPLADQFPEQPDTQGARRALNIPEGKKVLAVMPGSRKSEVATLGELFLQVAQRCQQRYPELEILIPAASPDRMAQLKSLVANNPAINVRLLDGQSHRVMEASDAVLLASGTTALEAMLLKKPMVVSYRVGYLSSLILSRMLKTPFVSLPNLLAGKELVPELLQDDATVDNITTELLLIFGDCNRAMSLQSEFTELHRQLRQNASDLATDSLLG